MKKKSTKSTRTATTTTTPGTPDNNDYPYRIVVVDDYTITTFFFSDTANIKHDLLGDTDDTNNTESYYTLMTVPIKATTTTSTTTLPTLKGSASYGGRGSSRTMLMELSKDFDGLVLNVDNNNGYSSLNFLVQNMENSLPIVIISSNYQSMEMLKKAMITVDDVGAAPVKKTSTTTPITITLPTTTKATTETTATTTTTETTEEEEEYKVAMKEYQQKVNNAKYKQSSLEYVFKALIDKLDEFEKEGEEMKVKFVKPEEMEDAKNWLGAQIAAAAAVKELQAC